MQVTAVCYCCAENSSNDLGKLKTLNIVPVKPAWDVEIN